MLLISKLFVGLFPPPTTPDEVGSRVLHQQRIEEQGVTILFMHIKLLSKKIFYNK